MLLLGLVLGGLAGCDDDESRADLQSETSLDSSELLDSDEVETSVELDLTDGELSADLEELDVTLADFEHDPTKVVLHGPCPLETRVGGFKVEMNEDVGYTSIDGSVRDGVVPGLVPLEAVVEGPCKLLRKRRLVCNPTCDSSQTCGYDETCMPMPLGQDLGTVTLRGLVKPVVELSPIQPGNLYFYTRLTHPGFAPDDVIQLTSTPGYLGALELYGVGVSQLESMADKWVLTQGQPLLIEWAAPAAGARSTLSLELNIDQHGLTPVNLVCELEDIGSASLSATLVDAFIAQGVTGFPSGRVIRRTVDSVVVAEQCVDFQVTSVRTMALEVTGFIPCTTDANCPTPTTCNLLIQQCQ